MWGPSSSISRRLPLADLDESRSGPGGRTESDRLSRGARGAEPSRDPRCHVVPPLARRQDQPVVLRSRTTRRPAEPTLVAPHMSPQSRPHPVQPAARRPRTAKTWRNRPPCRSSPTSSLILTTSRPPSRAAASTCPHRSAMTRVPFRRRSRAELGVRRRGARATRGIGPRAMPAFSGSPSTTTSASSPATISTLELVSASCRDRAAAFISPDDLRHPTVGHEERTRSTQRHPRPRHRYPSLQQRPDHRPVLHRSRRTARPPLPGSPPSAPPTRPAARMEVDLSHRHQPRS